MFEAVKHISKQKESSITVKGMNELLKEAKIPRTLMGYDSWGNFSYSQVLYVIENIGYIAKRKEQSKDSSVAIKFTSDGKYFESGSALSSNEKKVFIKLGLKVNADGT